MIDCVLGYSTGCGNTDF